MQSYIFSLPMFDSYSASHECNHRANSTCGGTLRLILLRIECVSPIPDANDFGSTHSGMRSPPRLGPGSMEDRGNYRLHGNFDNSDRPPGRGGLERGGPARKCEPRGESTGMRKRYPAQG